MTNQEEHGESTHETVTAAITQLPEKLHMPKAIGVLTNLILISLTIAGIVGFVIYKIDKKVEAMVTTNKVIQEFALKNSEQTVLLKTVDEKLGSKCSIQTKVQVAQTIHSLATIKRIPIHLICGLIETESEWTPSVVSGANAKGLMQILPGTARPYLRSERIDYGPEVLFDPIVNVTVGISLLADLHAGHVEAGKEKEDDFSVTLHSYFWGTANTAQLYGAKDGRVNVPNMSYPMRVLAKAKVYKEKGL